MNCSQCDFKFKNEKGLNIHIGKAHKDTIPQTDGHTDDIAADVAVQTSDVKPKDVQDNGTQTDSPLEKVLDEKPQEPFELKLKTPEKKHSSDIYDSYLEEPLPLNMPKTVLHPFDGVGVFDCYLNGNKNIFRYMFKNKGTCWKNIYIGENPPGYRR